MDTFLTQIWTRLRRHPLGLTVALATTHAVLGGLALIGRSTFSWPVTTSWVAAAGTHQAWPVLHLAIAAALTVTAARSRGVRWAARASVGVMSAWALLSIVWALSVPAPVSLAGGALGLTLGVPVAIWCAETWSRLERPDNEGRGSTCGC